jgi:4'-phosphopantetheinyl transferase
MCEAFVIVIERDLFPHEYHTLLRLVSQEKRERIEQFHYFADAQRTLLGDVLVRMIAGEKLGLAHHQIKFSHNAYGKPFLAGYDQYHFNVSHAGRYVACVADEEPVGIDVEVIKQVDLKIAQRFFSEDEKEFLFSRPEDQKQKTFYQIWTSKESYIKRDGRGLSIPLSSFSVYSAPDVCFHRIFENEEAVCTVCTAAQRKPPAFQTFSVEGMLRGV